VLANAVGEVVGLGGTALIGGVLVALTSRAGGAVAQIAAAVAFVAAGTLIEGAAVGVAQWRVLHRALPALAGRDWVRTTAAGAGVAWALGMVPSTVMAVREQTPPPTGAASSPPPAFDGPLVFVLAAAMGLLLGPILAWFQWRVLRRHLPRAAKWVPANAAAWALGMPVIFIATSIIGPGMPVPVIVAVAFVCLAGAGAVVGAVHGAVLARLLFSETAAANPDPRRRR
jgi:hypothetical protein